MTDFPTAPPEKDKTELGRFWRAVFAVSGFLFRLLLIAYLTLRGAPENSLHQSALSWAFMLFGGILGGVGFGAVLPFLPTKK